MNKYSVKTHKTIAAVTTQNYRINLQSSFYPLDLLYCFYNQQQQRELRFFCCSTSDGLPAPGGGPAPRCAQDPHGIESPFQAAGSPQSGGGGRSHPFAVLPQGSHRPGAPSPRSQPGPRSGWGAPPLLPPPRC